MTSAGAAFAPPENLKGLKFCFIGAKVSAEAAQFDSKEIEDKISKDLLTQLGKYKITSNDCSKGNALQLTASLLYNVDVNVSVFNVNWSLYKIDNKPSTPGTVSIYSRSGLGYKSGRGNAITEEIQDYFLELTALFINDYLSVN